MKTLIYCFQSAKIMLALMVFLSIFGQEAYAKKTVTRSLSTSSIKGGNLSNKPPRYALYCDGFYTLITTDDQGRTQVYVNDDGNYYSTSEAYRIDLPAGDDWSSYHIYGGCNQADTCLDNKMHIRMTGGSVGKIILNNRNVNFKGKSELEINSGIVNNIQLSYPGDLDEEDTGASNNVTVAISNLRYTGSSSIKVGARASKTMLFINTNCEFYDASARLTADDVADVYSYLIPDADAPQDFVAKGAVILPRVSAECDNFKDNGITSLASVTGGSYTVRKCDGWKSTKSVPSVVKVRAHNQISYVTQQATCTQPELTRTYCDLCNSSDNTVQTKEALGHETITDETVAATCYSTGLTEGSHCGRCGVIFVAQKTTDQKQHSWTDGSTIEMPCMATPSRIQVRMCKNCLMLMTPSSVTLTHGNLIEVTASYRSSVDLDTKTGATGRTTAQLLTLLKKRAKAATCTKAGLKFSVCTKCQFFTTQTIAATNHSSKTLHDAVTPTCEAGGQEAYSSCNSCDAKFKESDNTKFVDLGTIYVNPKGHKYGVDASKIANSSTLVSAATCSSPAIYHQTCANGGCGHVNEDLIFYDGSALGHQGVISSVDYSDPECPEYGVLTMACNRDGCGKTWPSFPFDKVYKLGDFEDGNTGYWCQTNLTEVTTIPTCRVKGEGTYVVKATMDGTNYSTKTYTSTVRENPLYHDYDDNGNCRNEKHYKLYTWNATDEPAISGYGEYSYAWDDDPESTEPIIDNIDYSVKGALSKAVSRQAFQYRDSPWTDLSDASLYYAAYEQTRCATQADFLSALLSQTQNFTADYYDDIALDICTTPSAQLSKLKGCTEAKVVSAVTNLTALNMHGNNIYAYLNDGSQYAPSLLTRITQNSDVRYIREFKNTNWQAVFLPIDMNTAYLPNGVHLATIDNVTENSDGSLVLSVVYKTSGWTDPNVAYLMKVDAPGVYSIRISNAYIDPATNYNKDYTLTDYNVSITGTHTGVSGQAMLDNKYFALSGGKLMRTSSNKVSLKPQRWYMSITDKSGNPIEATTMRVVEFEDDAETTALQTVRESVQSDVYTLDGRKVNDEENLAPGFYVQNGKRIIIK